MGFTRKFKTSLSLTQPVSITLLNKATGKALALSKMESFSSEWLAGFCTGESNFFIAVSRDISRLLFSIGQDSRDIALLESIVEFFCCGKVYTYKNREVCEFVVTKIDDIVNIIIPFFDKKSISGSKHLDYIKFKEAAYIIKNKKHLNIEGMNRIKELKNTMNKNC